MIVEKGRVMKVGNSKCLVLSKFICNNLKLEKGDNMEIFLTESGLLIRRKEEKEE